MVRGGNVEPDGGVSGHVAGHSPAAVRRRRPARGAAVAARPPWWSAALLAAAGLIAAPPVVAAPDAAPRAVALVSFAAADDGTALAARAADEPVNPASVVKVGTTLLALERLGPSHRFVTRFAANAAADPATGRLDSALVVTGDGDPDFQVENVFLVAAALNAVGVAEVHGDLVVGPRVWVGWEGGAARRDDDAARRARTMATRLRDALDPGRWSEETRRAWTAFAARRALATPARVVVHGHAGALEGVAPARVVVEHRSSALAHTLKRFNVYSNNDIERLEGQLGPPAAVADALAARLGVPADAVRLETLSGLGTNRLTPRAIVRLVDALARTCTRLGLAIEDVLPVAGCDPGTLARFPDLERGLARAVVGKTGTLATTDGGVAMLAGIAYTVRGPVTFAVAAPGAGAALAAARHAEERFVLDLVRAQGGPAPKPCGAPAGWSDDGATVAGR